jgi:hypothetical protein
MSLYFIKTPHLYVYIWLSMFSIDVFSRWHAGQSATKLSTWFDPPLLSDMMWSISKVWFSRFLQCPQYHFCRDATYFFLVSLTDRFIFAADSRAVPPINLGCLEVGVGTTTGVLSLNPSIIPQLLFDVMSMMGERMLLVLLSMGRYFM